MPKTESGDWQQQPASAYERAALKACIDKFFCQEELDIMDQISLQSWPFNDIKPKVRAFLKEAVFFVDSEQGNTVAKFRDARKAYKFAGGKPHLKVRMWHPSEEEYDRELAEAREEFRQQYRVFCHGDLAAAKNRRRTYKKHGIL